MMLLDTCAFLWAAWQPSKLSNRAAQLLGDPSVEVYFSAVSAWEIAIKHALGRLPLPDPPHELVPTFRERFGFKSLPLSEEASLRIATLPKVHADPFDRALIGQAIEHGLAILTPDPAIQQYPVKTLW